MTRYIILFATILFFASCKNDKVANEKDNLSVGELAYNKQPTKENAETALSEVSNQIIPMKFSIKYILWIFFSDRSIQIEFTSHTFAIPYYYFLFTN